MTLMVWLGGAQRTIRQNGYGILDQNSTLVFLKVAKEVGNCASVDAAMTDCFAKGGCLMHKRILVPRAGTAFAGAVLSRVQMPARLVSACCKRAEMELVKAPLGLRNSVTDNQLANADA